MSGRLLLRTPEVAELLGMSVGVFRNHLRELRARGFPRFVPGMGFRYDPRAIEAWLAAQRAQAAPPASADRPAVEDVPAWQAELDRRAGLLRH